MLVCSLAACALHGPQGHERYRPLLADGLSIGSVEVVVDPHSHFPEASGKTMNRYDVPGRLRTSVLRRLRRRHLYDVTSPWRLHITVTAFHLRPDIAALLPVPILGDDRLTLFVAMLHGNKVRASFSVRGHYDQGGLFGAVGRLRRLELVIEAASFRVLAALRGVPGRAGHRRL